MLGLHRLPTISKHSESTFLPGRSWQINGETCIYSFVYGDLSISIDEYQGTALVTPVSHHGTRLNGRSTRSTSPGHEICRIALSRYPGRFVQQKRDTGRSA